MAGEDSSPIVQFEIGSHKNFVYLILDSVTRKAAIVDPQADLSRPLAKLEGGGFELTMILLTHTHWDHTAGVGPLLVRWPGLELRVGERDLYRLKPEAKSAPGLRVLRGVTGDLSRGLSEAGAGRGGSFHEARGVGEEENAGAAENAGDAFREVLRAGETFHVGSLGIHAFPTPGHSPGAWMYFIDRGAGVDTPHLFTGDTVFIRDCGRTDLEGGSNQEMFESLQKVRQFPPETRLWVGHHYQTETITTLGAELRESPPFQCRSVEELAVLP